MKHTSRAESRKYARPPGRAIVKVTMLPRKSAKHPTWRAPVPQTDTRGRVEYTKALGRFTVKELGKMTP